MADSLDEQTPLTPERTSLASQPESGGVDQKRSRVVMKIRISVDRWPLVVITWPDAPLGDAAVKDYLRRSNELFDRRERMVAIHDATFAPRPTATQRMMIAENLRSSAEDLRRYVIAVGIVTPSAIVRGAVTAINWVAPAPFPQRTFSTFAEAEAWVMEKIRAAPG